MSSLVKSELVVPFFQGNYHKYFLKYLHIPENKQLRKINTHFYILPIRNVFSFTVVFLHAPVTTTFNFTSPFKQVCPEYQTGCFRLEETDVFPYIEYITRHLLSFVFQGTQTLGVSTEVVCQKKNGFFSRKRPYLFSLRCPGTATMHFQHCLDLLTGTTKPDLQSSVLIIKTHKITLEEAYSFRRRQMD